MTRASLYTHAAYRDESGALVRVRLRDLPSDQVMPSAREIAPTRKRPAAAPSDRKPKSSDWRRSVYGVSLTPAQSRRLRRKSHGGTR